MTIRFEGTESNGLEYGDKPGGFCQKSRECRSGGEQSHYLHLVAVFASPGGEAELAINPVASMESVVRDVSLILGSAIRQVDERQNEDVPVLWRSVDEINDTGRQTMAGRVNSRKSAGPRRSCN